MRRKRLFDSFVLVVVLSDRRCGGGLPGDEKAFRRCSRGRLGEKNAPARGRTGARAAVRNDPGKYRSHETKMG